jgi:subtilisin-like proprotein convertase family protein
MPADATDLVQNAARYLTASQAPGECSLGGTCVLEGGYDYSGVELRLSGQPLQVTGPDGAFLFEGLWPGLYQLEASKEGYTTVDSTLILGEGQQILDLVLFMQAMEFVEEYSYCELQIPDNDPTGVTDSLWIGSLGELLDISVIVDIVHSYIGDLKVKLIHPQGQEVLLHNRSGGSGDAIFGSYPEDLVPAEDLSVLLGLGARGWWRLEVSDWESWDTGILHSWGLRLGLPVFATDAVDPAPAFALHGNWPNPFNPSTCLEFSLDAPGRARLGVYDLRGRLLARPLDEDLAAGTHSVLWHGRDQAGRTLPSGVYLARLQCGGRTAMKKMILLK